MRALAVLIVVALLAVPAAAHAQTQDDGNSAFGPLPAAPTPNPEPIVVQQESDSGDDVSRTLLFVIAGGLLLTFLVIGRVIFRDARRHVPTDARAQTSALREEGPHRHAKHAKARARARGKAQKAARRRNR